jgi:hypothetical protein
VNPYIISISDRPDAGMSAPFFPRLWPSPRQCNVAFHLSRSMAEAAAMLSHSIKGMLAMLHNLNAIWRTQALHCSATALSALSASFGSRLLCRLHKDCAGKHKLRHSDLEVSTALTHLHWSYILTSDFGLHHLVYLQSAPAPAFLPRPLRRRSAPRSAQITGGSCWLHVFLGLQSGVC